ncbi:membrane protein insertion efficiency factor YidD [Holosporaceae bacterium 'Namur']|nr:membrane protein insertion efficiency factor YidD [Holosporaceae bacterium 'Namur']
MIKCILSFISQILKFFIFIFIKFYQYTISPMLPPTCRFRPTCSEYAMLAINKHGMVKGVTYGLIRILKCNPLFSAGFDPVPQNKGKQKCQINKD